MTTRNLPQLQFLLLQNGAGWEMFDNDDMDLLCANVCNNYYEMATYANQTAEIEKLINFLKDKEFGKLLELDLPGFKRSKMVLCKSN